MINDFNNVKAILSCKKQNFQKMYFKSMYEAESNYYMNPSKDSLNYITYLYKIGIEHFTSINEQYSVFLTMRMNSIVNTHLEIEKKLKLMQLKTKIINKLNEFEKSSNLIPFEEELHKKSKELINNSEKNKKSTLQIIKLSLRNQKNNFLLKAKNKLIKKYIQKSLTGNNELNYNGNSITPMKSIDNNYLLNNQLMVRTNDEKNNFINHPTKIFFDEDKNFLSKINFNNLKKVKRFDFEKITDNFLCRYTLSYNYLVNEYLKKIVDFLNENYNEKLEKYKSHFDLNYFYKMMIKDKSNNIGLFEKEIALHDENIEFLNYIDELNVKKKDGIIDIIDRIKIDNPIDNKETSCVLNEYIYKMMELFI